MEMRWPAQFGIPDEIIDLWRQKEGPELLPVQELASQRHGLFATGNLLIQAPTSAGKTFSGEMAAVQTALHRKRAIYLVSLKALDEEKYCDFRRKYEVYGLTAIISTRDYRQNCLGRPDRRTQPDAPPETATPRRHH